MEKMKKIYYSLFSFIFFSSDLSLKINEILKILNLIESYFSWLKIVFFTNTIYSVDELGTFSANFFKLWFNQSNFIFI